MLHAVLLAGWLAQAIESTPTPTPGGDHGGGGPGIDIGALANGIVNGILDGLANTLTKWLNGLAGDAAKFIRDGLATIWEDVWSSGANILNPPLELTIDFPPAQFLGNNIFVLVYGIAVLAVVLLGLRILWGTMTGRGGALDDTINGVLLGFFLAAVSTLVVAKGFDLAKMGSDAFGRFSYAPTFDPHTLTSIGPDFFLSVFTLVVMLVYGWRLILRSAYRMVLLMFLGPLAPVAAILWSIPQIRWVAVLYWVTLGGWLAGGFLAIGAVSLAIQIATVGNTNHAFFSLVFGVALIQVATDLMSILPKGATGGISVGSPFGALVSGLVGGMAGGAMGVAAGGAAAEMGSVAGALPSGDRAGFGYE